MQTRKSLVRKRFMTVDTLGLVLRVFVTAANLGAREGGKQVLKLFKQSSKQASRLITIWVDGGFDGEPFMQWVMNFCHWTRAGSPTVTTNQGLCCTQKTLGRGAHFRLVDGVPAIS